MNFIAFIGGKVTRTLVIFVFSTNDERSKQPKSNQNTKTVSIKKFELVNAINKIFYKNWELRV